MKTNIYVLIILPFLISAYSQGQSQNNQACLCSEVFAELTSKIESNYLAHRKLVEAGKDGEYIKKKAAYIELTHTANAEDCTRILQQFLQQFNDGHLFVFEKPSYTEEQKKVFFEKAVINRRNIDDVLLMLQKQGNGQVTGKWSDGNYDVAVIKEGNHYNGYTINESDTLPAGSLLASFDATNSTDMYGTLYNYEHEPKSIVVNTYKENTLMSFRGAKKWGRIDGGPQREINLINSSDITQPSIEFIDDETSLLTIPSFSSDPIYLRDILLENAPAVTSRSKLIVDVRGNTGGNAVYFGFIPVYATQSLPSYEPGEVLASEDIKSYFERLTQRNPDIYQPVLDRITNKLGQIVEGPKYPGVPLEAYPSQIENVAILTDEGCMSACESFILHSKAMSNKVKVFGKNTAGVIDYTSVMSMKLESSGDQNIYFGFPTSSLGNDLRSDQYPNGFNATGIIPDVLIPDTVDDKILFTSQNMR